MNIFREILAIIGLAAAFGLGSWLLHPKAPGWKPEPYSAYEKELREVEASASPIIWVDARQAEAYEKEHIPQAIRLTEKEWDPLLEALLMEHWQPEQWVVVYCDNASCQKSQKITARLRAAIPGIQAYYLKGGWDAWRNR